VSLSSVKPSSFKIICAVSVVRTNGEEIIFVIPFSFKIFADSSTCFLPFSVR
jgi:hypothetical protein